MLENLRWLGHASFKISGEKNIYIDPWKLGKEEPADIILISHDHYDHCSPDDVAKLKKDLWQVKYLKRKLRSKIKEHFAE